MPSRTINIVVVADMVQFLVKRDAVRDTGMPLEGVIVETPRWDSSGENEGNDGVKWTVSIPIKEEEAPIKGEALIIAARVSETVEYPKSEVTKLLQEYALDLIENRQTGSGISSRLSYVYDNTGGLLEARVDFICKTDPGRKNHA